jgi:hypothetical protein
MYRTVLAWRSTGAPDRTAAGRSRPGSEPSMTLLGIGEKVLSNVSTLAPALLSAALPCDSYETL